MAASSSSRLEEDEVNAVCAEPKLFLGGLRYDVTADDVRSHYAARYGALRSVVLLTHHETGKSKGCALVLFETWAAAEAAVSEEHGAQTDLSAPRTAVVKFADPQRNEQGVLCGLTPRKLFIGQVGAYALPAPCARACGLDPAA
jgi:RNA recognition motif-containing protein